MVFTRDEARLVLARLDGIRWVMASLLYGSGLRLMECTRLRVKDVDFHQHQLIVRDGKGSKDRITMLPDRLVEPLKRHLDKVSVLYKKDLSEGFGAVYLPFALEKKYPNANREWGGSTYSRPHIAPSIRAPGSSGAITSTPRYCSAR